MKKLVFMLFTCMFRQLLRTHRLFFKKKVHMQRQSLYGIVFLFIVLAIQKFIVCCLFLHLRTESLKYSLLAFSFVLARQLTPTFKPQRKTPIFLRTPILPICVSVGLEQRRHNFKVNYHQKIITVSALGCHSKPPGVQNVCVFLTKFQHGSERLIHTRYVALFVYKQCIHI